MAKLNKNSILTRFDGRPLGTRPDSMTSVIKARKEHLVTMAGNRVNYPKARENKLPSRVRHFEKTKKKQQQRNIFLLDETRWNNTTAYFFLISSNRFQVSFVLLFTELLDLCALLSVNTELINNILSFAIKNNFAVPDTDLHSQT